MSGSNRSSNPSSELGSGNLKDSASTAASEITGTHTDSGFFTNLLRSSSTDDDRSHIKMDSNEFNPRKSNPSSDEDTNRASVIDQLLPQTSQTSMLRSNPYMINPIYSAFGMSLDRERDGNNMFDSTSGPNQAPESSTYNNVNLRTHPGVYNNASGANFFDSLNNQPNTSDRCNLFSGNSSSASNYSRSLFDNPQSESAEFSKTYSSVLHSSLKDGFDSWQQQQQAAGCLSLFDIQQQHCDFMAGQSGQRPTLVPGNLNKQRQIISEPTDSLNEFLLGRSNSQDLAPRPSTHSPNQQTKPSSLSKAQQRPLTMAANINFQQASPSQLHDRNLTLREKPSGSNISMMSGPSMGQKKRNKSPFFNVRSSLIQGQPGFKLDAHGTGIIHSDESERFSRKVFVGGLPPDIDEEEIKASFRRFGSLVVDWPHKAESKSYFPPKGYAFLLFQEESSVQTLIDSCYQEEDKLYLCVSSPTIKDKPVQIRPWRLSDSDFVLDSTLMLDPRKTVFVGGVPRPLKASELATIMNNLYGGVCYAGIDTDPELKYPKGAGRVAFSNHKSYIAAISARFVHIHHSEIEKRVEVKPYVLDDQFCDECQGSRCNNKFAPFFCANITCLSYYCESCWSTVHTQPGKEFHKPLVKECGDRPRGGQSFKW